MEGVTPMIPLMRVGDHTGSAVILIDTGLKGALFHFLLVLLPFPVWPVSGGVLHHCPCCGRGGATLIPALPQLIAGLNVLLILLLSLFIECYLPRETHKALFIPVHWLLICSTAVTATMQRGGRRGTSWLLGGSTAQVRTNAACAGRQPVISGA